MEACPSQRGSELNTEDFSKTGIYSGVVVTHTYVSPEETNYRFTSALSGKYCLFVPESVAKLLVIISGKQ